MDNKKIGVFVAIIIAISSCGRLNNPKERNILAFKDETKNVTDAIYDLNNILNSSNVEEYFFYAIDKDVLYITDSSSKSQKVGFILDTLLYKNTLLSFIDVDKRKRFIDLVLYLNNNHIDRCDFVNRDFIYLYRSNIYMADRQKDLKRYIILANDIGDINLNQYKIIDCKKNLFLLSHKDAEIWEN